MALTKRAVDALRFDPRGGAKQVLWDDELRGFGCRVYPTGRKSFVLQRRVKGRERLITLGAYGALTPKQARDMAIAHLAAIARGDDPAETAQAKKRRTETVREFSTVYMERHARARKRSWREDQRRLDKYVLPALGSRPLASVTRADVGRLHSKIGKHAPVEANRVLALLGVMFTKADEWGHVPEGFGNPTARVKAFREKSRDRWVTPAELPALMAAINRDESIYVRAFFVLALLLGTRRSELLRAEWRNVDLERMELRLTNTKAGNDHIIPLPRRAGEILASLPRMLGNPHVFPSPTAPGKPMRDVKRSWRRIRDEAGLPDVRLHDLRRTVGSWLATSGASLHLIGTVLNHADSETTKIYARLAEDATRNALEQHAERIFTVAGQ